MTLAVKASFCMFLMKLVFSPLPALQWLISYPICKNPKSCLNTNVSSYKTA